MLLRKGVFPYEYVASDFILEETSLPQKEYFYSKLKQSHISSEDYEFALEVFHEAKCRNIKDYLELYLKTDVLLLTEIFENFRKNIYSNYNLDPAQLLTISSTAMQAALLQYNKGIELLRDISVITEFESSIRGGFTSVVKGKATFNNKYLNDFDPNKPISTGIFLDINSLYGTVLHGKLPVGDFKELSEEEIMNFNIDDIDLNGEFCYALSIDFEIPDDVKKLTDDFPLGLRQEEISFEDLSEFSQKLSETSGVKFIKQKSLVASHKPQEKYLISLNLLKLFKDIGLECKKIHRIFRFRQEALFKDFIEKNIELRTNAKSPFEKELFKLMSNSIYGKLLYNSRKNDTDTKLVTTEKRFDKLVCNPRLKECYPISENKLIMKLSADKIELKYPLYVGWFVLELSKYHMYNFYYNILKKTYGNNVNLVYSDTDSFLLNFENIDIYEEMGKEPLMDYIDTSNFPSNHELYSEKNKGKLGLLKSETADLPIKEAYCLAPKTYSVLLNNDETKNTAKGVNKSQKNELKHEIYKQIHDGTLKEIQSICPTIRSIKNNLYTLETKKHALVKLDRKRYWIDREISVGYGHPSIKDLVNEEPKSISTSEYPILHECSLKSDIKRIKTDSKRKLELIDEDIGLNLTYKRAKNVIGMFK